MASTPAPSGQALVAAAGSIDASVPFFMSCPETPILRPPRQPHRRDFGGLIIPIDQQQHITPSLRGREAALAPFGNARPVQVSCRQRAFLVVFVIHVPIRPGLSVFFVANHDIEGIAGVDRENELVARRPEPARLLVELVERGLAFSPPRLYIFAGGKPLHAPLR